MTLKGKTMAAGTRASLVSLCAACVLAAAVSQASVFVGSAQASDASEDVTNPYTISIPSELSVGTDGEGTIDIAGKVAANHKLTVTASSVHDGKLAGPAGDSVAYTLHGGTFTTSAHDQDATIKQQVTAKVTETPRYEGTYTDTVTFTLSCTATHTLTLDVQGGALPEGTEASIELEAGETYALPTPTRDGYTFNGWYPAPSDGTKVDPSWIMAAANVTLYAHWTEHVLTINYYSGYANRWQSYSLGNRVIDLDDTNDYVVETERVGYSALYAHPPYGLLNVSRLVKNGYHSATANGVYDVNGDWRVNGANAEQTVSAGNREGNPTGKDVAEWIGVLDEFNRDNVTVNLYPIFAPNTYTVMYDGNGATGGSTLSSHHTYDAPSALAANGFAKTGYKFDGWSIEPNGNVLYVDRQEVVNLTAENNGTVTLYAHWTLVASDVPEGDSAIANMSAPADNSDNSDNLIDSAGEETASVGNSSAGNDASSIDVVGDASDNPGSSEGDVSGSDGATPTPDSGSGSSVVSPSADGANAGADAFAPSSGAATGDDAAEPSVDDDTAEPDVLAGIFADAPTGDSEVPAPEPEAVALIPEAVLEDDQPQAAADVSQPESSR